MMPNSQDATLVKIIKVCGIFVFPLIIVTLLMILTFVPAPKKSNAPQTPQEIDAQIQKLQAAKDRLSEQ